jgi:peptidyl-prolyl cis-trans isomerase SurA
MKTNFYFLLLTSFFSLFTTAQINEKEILFTVNDEEVLASEFIRVYNKNLDLVKDESQKDIDNYLGLFVDYKLKLQEAKKLELDKKPEYLRELSNYRKQLAKNFLTDTQVTESLVKEAYDRISYEVNAGHVLVRLPEDAPVEDTLKAYNEIVKLRNQVLSEGFETVKNKVHNGQTIFAEDLGFFGGFRMVYSFESAAFNTPVGELSQPFRTRFGYHVVKIFDKRKSKGEIEVAHILVSKQKKEQDSVSQDPEQRIKDIYTKLQQGESFESLAKQFSEDKSSASKGGKLSPFSSGQLNSKNFEETAFSLATKDDYSEPVETEIGWHIIKLIRKKPVESFEKMKGQLELKVKRDSRSKLINDAFKNKIRAYYNVELNNEALEYFNSIVTDSFYKRTWEVPENLNTGKLLNIIGKKQITYGEFATYLKNAQRKLRSQKPLSIVVKENYKEFIDSSVLKYYEDNLENENEEFANIVAEYRDGLLLFELMESEIWNAAKKDSLGLKEFYDKNKSKYILNERVEVLVASSPKEKIIKKVSKMLSDGFNEEKIKETLNKKGKVDVIFTSGIMDKTHQALPSDFQFKEGLSKIYRHNDSFVIANVKKLLPNEQLTFEDAKGRVITDFQEAKEKSWIQNLRETYLVELNTDVLDKIKTQITNN